MKQGNIMEALELWILNNFLFIVFVGSGIVMLTALFKDFTGQTFNGITVLQQEGVSQDRRGIWRCRCKCGNEFLISRIP